MENNLKLFTELTEKEMLDFDGGHDGTAYDIGKSIGSFIREVAVEVAAFAILRKLSK